MKPQERAAISSFVTAEEQSVVGKSRRRKRSQKVLGNHQKCWLWGRHAVLESLRAGKWIPLELLVDASLLAPAVQAELKTLCGKVGLQIQHSTAARLVQLTGARDHQGLIARMPEYPYQPLDELMNRVGETSVLLILDGIQDPYNFGAILRSADLLSVDGVIVPRLGQAGVSSHVARSSVGAVNYVPIVQAASLTDALAEMRLAGFKVWGTADDAASELHKTSFSKRTAIVIGSEGTGMSEELRMACDGILRIPCGGHVGSFNAAVAAGILCYEIHRQRHSTRQG